MNKYFTFIVINKILKSLKSVCWSTSRFMGLRLGICATTVRRRIHPLQGCDFD